SAQTVDFDCYGTPVCNGSYKGSVSTSIPASGSAPVVGCPFLRWNGRFSIDGLDLSRPGSIQGSIYLFDFPVSVDTTGARCPVFASPSTVVMSYSGTWDGRTGTLSIDGAINLKGEFAASS